MSNYKGVWAGISLAAMALSYQTPISAQELQSGSLQPRTEDGREIYDAQQFARFNPRTALDIVRQVPGFIIDTGDNNERGLGQADENVLINGSRIAGKNVDAFTALGRISASNVVRLEIVDGATLSITGLSGQVLNVVTNSDAEGGLTGNFKWEPRFRRSGEAWYNGEMSVSGQLGNGELTLAFENDSVRNGGEGPESVTDRFGNILFRRDPEVLQFRFDRPKVSATYARSSEAGAVFNVGAEYALNRFRQSVVSTRVQAGQSDIFELFTGRENEWNAEFNVDYEFDLGGGRLKLIGLQRLEHSPFSDFFGLTFTDGVTPATGTRFDRTIDEGESVVRGEYNWKTQSGTDWGVSVEGAYNFLESESVLDGIPLANGNSKVTEYRGEILGSYGRALSDHLTLQASLGGEYSQIGQTGGNGLKRSFIRPKGSITFSLKPSDNMDVSLNIEREVGQLNFGDFIQSVQVDQNLGRAGNPNLVPPQSWKAELEMTKRLGPWGSGTVTIFGEKITDIVDAIPITPTTEARGNLPNANRFGVKLVSTVLFDPIGWKGAKLDIEGEVAKSSLRDPVTGVFRRTNDDTVFFYEVNLRHDIPNSDWAWGAGAEDFKNSDFLRLDQINAFFPGSVYSWIFVEHKDVFGLTVQANLGNLFNRGERFVRTNFVNRRNGPIDFIEDRTRKFGLVYRLTVSGSF